MAKKLSRKKKVMVWLGTLWGAFVISLLLFAYTSVAPPAGRTGGFGEPTCATSGCHNSFPLNSGSGSVTITVPESYTSGDRFPIIVTVSDPDARRWGFELSARTLSGQQAGNLIAGTDGFSQLLNSPSSIQYIGHTALGTQGGTTGSVSFNLQWEAPDVSAGPVIFHAAGDGSDGSYSPLGDRIYTTSATSQQQQITGQPPSVSDGGIVNSADFSAAVSPGLIVSLFGTNLTRDGATELTFFGSDGKLVTTLAGASVEVNGLAAPLFFASPGQINAMIPTELTGVNSATVEVTVDGQTSTPQTIFVDPVSPAIFTIPSGGDGPGAIIHADGSLVTGQNPAEPGEVIVIFCTGLGEVDPPLASGTPAGLHTTVTPVTVTIDGVDAVVQFSGMAPGFVGLNQVNVEIPAGVTPGPEVPLVLFQNGVPSNSVTIVVQ